ncbi:MAG: hypothetical protein KDC84_07525 [Crocinitomicaceae bacterium]|nr:hypothetical protein [Crocinitomicaceae bacterium]
MIFITVGFLYLVMIVSKYRENDSFFYIGLGVLALYTIFAYKMVESMEDSDQENDEDQS